MKMTKKAKKLTAIVSGAVAVAITVTVICIEMNKPLSTVTTENTLKSQTDIILKIPTTPGDTNMPSEQQKNQQIKLDVGGNPTLGPNTNNATNNNNSQNNSNNSNQATQKPPSVTVDIIKDTTQPKPTPTPTITDPSYPTNPDDWTPPPSGVGTGEPISEGFENEPIDISTNITTLQTNLSFVIGDELLNGGYNTLIPNAGSAKQLVEDSVKVYAESGNVNLNPASYGLPKLIAFYNIKIKAQGTNALEAGKYIANYMKNDSTFNNMVSAKLGMPKDGYVAVY